MNRAQIEAYVMRYLEAEQCGIIEKHPAYVTVKLSPSADKDLTYRPYYWSFVERTGATPETMTCTFIFDPDGHRAAVQAAGAPAAPGLPGMKAAVGARPAAPGGGPGTAVPPQPIGASPGGAPAMTPGAAPSSPGVSPAAPTPIGAMAPQPQPDSILGRYFGFVPTQTTARIPKDEVTFGSRRLEQIFAAVRSKGRFVHMYEHFAPERRATATVPYENWLQVNFKVDLACDMKRSEIHSLGIHLGTGEIRGRFQEFLQSRPLTPRLPPHIFIVPDKIALPRAVIYLEEFLEQRLRSYDHGWAEEAGERLDEELERISGYYQTLIQSAEPDKRPEVETQYLNRRQEIEWQYKPRIIISVINCGLFHLKMNVPSSN